MKRVVLLSVVLISLAAPTRAEACSLCSGFGGPSTGNGLTTVTLSMYAAPMTAMLVIDAVLLVQFGVGKPRQALATTGLGMAIANVMLSGLAFALSIIDPSTEATAWKVGSAGGLVFSAGSLVLAILATREASWPPVTPLIGPTGVGVSVRF